MPGKFEIKKAKNGQFFFHLKASNGEIILASETYKTKRSARNGIASVQKNAPEAARYDRRKGKGDKPYFVLKAANGQINLPQLVIQVQDGQVAEVYNAKGFVTPPKYPMPAWNAR